MNVKLIGEFSCSRFPYSEFVEQLLTPFCEGIISNDAEVYILNHHDPEEEVLDSVFDENVKPEGSPDKTIVLVNWGAKQGSESMLTDNTYTFLNNLKLCSADTIRCAVAEDEYCVKNKEGHQFVISRKYNGYTIVYFLWDAFHLITKEAISLIQSQLTAVAINMYSPCFEEKFAHVEVEGEQKGESVKFKSIFQAAQDVLSENKEDVQNVIQEMINKAPIKELVAIINKSLNSGSQPCGHPQFVTKKDVQKWLVKWAEAKWPYYIMFGREYEIRKDFSYQLDANRDSVLINAMLNEIKMSFVKYAPTLDMFTYDEFFNNQIIHSHEQINRYKKITRGEKLTKFLSSFLQDKDFDTALSYFVQEKKFKSVIHISINPMDFLTSSYNQHDWKSCHNFINGQYGAGSMSYMFDQGSVIAFMASDKPYVYGDDKNSFSWNSKCWRQIVYGSYYENTFIFCRQYPKTYSNDSVADSVRSLLEECVSNFCQIPNLWIKKNNGAKRDYEYKNDPSSAHYDDVPNNNTVYVRSKFNRNPVKKIIAGSCGYDVKTSEKIDYSRVTRHYIVNP